MGKNIEETRRFKNSKDQKAFLQNEVAKELDPEVKAALASKLAKMEKKEKFTKRLVWVFIVVFILAFSFFVYALGDGTDKTVQTQPKQSTTKITESDTSVSETVADTMTTEPITEEVDQTQAPIITSSSQSSDTTVIDDTNEVTEMTEEASNSDIIVSDISDEEARNWVLAVLNQGPAPETAYILDVTTDPDDHLTYIQVAIDQMDGAGTFRINSQGELETRGAITGSVVNPNWTLVSEKFMDTSIAAEFFANRDEE